MTTLLAISGWLLCAALLLSLRDAKQSEARQRRYYNEAQSGWRDSHRQVEQLVRDKSDLEVQIRIWREHSQSLAQKHNELNAMVHVFTDNIPLGRMN